MRNFITFTQIVAKSSSIGTDTKPVRIRASHITAFFSADATANIPHYHRVVECGGNVYKIMETCGEIEALINKAEGT